MVAAYIEIYGMLSKYQDRGIALVLFAVSYVYLMSVNKEFRRKIGWAVLLMLLLMFNPLLYQYLWKRLMRSTYWRIFWVLGESIIYCLALLDIAFRFPKRRIGIILSVSGCVVMVVFGSFVYTGGAFKEAENKYKIPQDAIDISDIILSKGSRSLAVLPKKLYNYARQYTNKIDMLYGRNVQGYTQWFYDEDIMTVQKQLKTKKTDYATVSRICHELQVSYIAINKRKNIDFEQYGYSLVGGNEDYEIYENTWGEVVYPQWLVEKCESSGAEGGLYKVTDSYGRAFLIGSGSKDNIDSLNNILSSSKISAWMIPGCDEQQMAFCEAIKNNLDVSVEEYFIPHIFNAVMERMINSGEAGGHLDTMYSAIQSGEPGRKYVIAEEGENYDVIGLNAFIINNYTGHEIFSSVENVCKIAFLLESSEQKLLYVPDLTEEIVQRVKETPGANQIELLIIGNNGEVDQLLKKELIDYCRPGYIMDESTVAGECHVIK